MAAPSPVPSDHFTESEFFGDIDPQDLVYFLVNVGDGDGQLVVLPAERDGQSDRAARDRRRPSPSRRRCE